MTSDVRENRLRRVAQRRGFRIEKSRRRDPMAVDFGGYMLIENDRNYVVLGANRYDATLDQIEAYLEGDRDG